MVFLLDYKIIAINTIDVEQFYDILDVSKSVYKEEVEPKTHIITKLVNTKIMFKNNFYFF